MAAAPKLPAEAEKYRTITDAHEIGRIIEHAKMIQAKMTFRLEGQMQKYEGHISESSRADRGVIVETDANFSLEAFEQNVARNPEAKILLLTALGGQVLVGFRAGYQPTKDGSLVFEFPKQVMKIQRRNHPRLVILSGYEIFVQVDSVVSPSRVERRLLDISEGGLGFLVQTAVEADKFRKGMTMTNIRITLHNHMFLVDAVIRSHVTLGPTSRHKGIKIGVQFTRIRPEDVEFISSYVIEHLPYTDI